MRRTTLALAALALLAFSLAAQPAGAAVGVERVSRPAASAGETLRVTLGCGFCYPPCEGKPARNTPCMLDTDRQPPRGFPLSIVPIGRVPEPFPCGRRMVCSPVADRPPARAPFTFLGEAIPPPNIEEIRESGRNYVPRYRLEFEVPKRRPGNYAFVIFCDVCLEGEGGSLIAEPRLGRWSFRIRSPLVTISLAERLYAPKHLFSHRIADRS